MTKKLILSKIKELVKQYVGGSHDGTNDSCPLCKLFYHGDKCSKKCPNNVFGPFKTYPCVKRCLNFDYLDWNCYEHRLVEYWKAIYLLLKKEKAYDVINMTDELQSKILKIANKINTL
jgi:hypothetical protein